MKVLHITSWYPEIDNPSRAIFIKRHIEALDLYCQNQTLHFEIVKSNWFSIETLKTEKVRQTIIHSPIFFWSLIEIVHLLWLFLKLIIQGRHKQFDLINFHIAYPMLSYWHWIKKKITTPIVITEHWSAYKNNFGIKKELPLVKNIFCQNIPIIAVSNVLVNDIQKFSGCEFNSFIVPNVIDSSIFYPDTNKNIDRITFLMCSYWKEPKRPMLALESFKELHQEYKDIKLNIIGDGPLKAKMEKWIIENNMEGNISLLGSKKSEEIADLMRASEIFLHPTEYETFSVVCAEALSCGLVVIASNKGAIPEVMHGSGILVENTIESWSRAMKKYLSTEIKPLTNWTNPYSNDAVGKIYSKVLISIVNDAS